MWSKVNDYIKRHKLLDTNSLYLVALSGGADSVALLLMLHEAGYQTHAAHCNFHLRGEESNRDEEFCVALCSRLDIPLHRVHFDTAIYAEKRKVSIEMAAREQRYSWFEQLRRQQGLDFIAVAHHRDDAIETFFINLLRGTGIAGLCGMKALSGHIVRPLLDVSRDDIDRFVAENGLEYIDDRTNATDLYLRNRIRHQLLPLLRDLSPAFDATMSQNLRNLTDANQVFQAAIDTLRLETVTHRPDGIDSIPVAAIDALRIFIEGLQVRDSILCRQNIIGTRESREGILLSLRHVAIVHLATTVDMLV